MAYFLGVTMVIAIAYAVTISAKLKEPAPVPASVPASAPASVPASAPVSAPASAPETASSAPNESVISYPKVAIVTKSNFGTNTVILSYEGNYGQPKVVAQLHTERDEIFAVNAFTKTFCRSYILRKSIIECWVNGSSESILNPDVPESLPSGSLKRMIMKLSPYGDQLVWRERNRGQLWLTNLNSLRSMLILPFDAESDIDIFSIDWIIGEIFWTQGRAQNAVMHDIFRASMSDVQTNVASVNRKPIASINSHIKALTCNPDEKMLFWIGENDQDIQQLSYDRRDPTPLGIKSYPAISNMIPDSLEYYAGFLYWFEAVPNGERLSLARYNLSSPRIEVQALILPDGGLPITALSLYDNAMMKNENPCKELGCNHICIPNKRQGFPDCICPYEKPSRTSSSKGINDKTCPSYRLFLTSAPRAGIIPILQKSEVRLTTIDLNQPFLKANESTVDTSEIRKEVASLFHLIHAKVERCLGIHENDSTYCLSMGKKYKELALNASQANQNFLSADLLPDCQLNTIWIDDRGCIKTIASGTGRNQTFACLPNDIRFNGVVVDTKNRAVFYTVENDNKIYRKFLDEPAVLAVVAGDVNRKNIDRTSMAIDPESKTLYWLYGSSLNNVSYYGTNSTLISASSSSASGRSLAYMNGALYWIESDSTSDTIVRFDLKTLTKSLVFRGPEGYEYQSFSFVEEKLKHGGKESKCISNGTVLVTNSNKNSTTYCCYPFTILISVIAAFLVKMN